MLLLETKDAIEPPDVAVDNTVDFIKSLAFGNGHEIAITGRWVSRKLSPPIFQGCFEQLSADNVPFQ